MTTTDRRQVEMMLLAFTAKDLDAVLALFADDAALTRWVWKLKGMLCLQNKGQKSSA